MSSDRSQAGFDEYYGEMPWLALNFADKARASALASKYGVRGKILFQNPHSSLSPLFLCMFNVLTLHISVPGIPCLVLVDKDGNTITTDGRAGIFLKS